MVWCIKCGDSDKDDSEKCNIESRCKKKVHWTADANFRWRGVTVSLQSIVMATLYYEYIILHYHTYNISIK